MLRLGRVPFAAKLTAGLSDTDKCPLGRGPASDGSLTILSYRRSAPPREVGELVRAHLGPLTFSVWFLRVVLLPCTRLLLVALAGMGEAGS